MKELSSIYQFFSAINCHFQCYEMGRLIQAIEEKQFIDFEQNIIPWSAPFMQHAWIGLIFWPQEPENKSSNQTLKQAESEQNHTVWFLKLPLDEQAKLNLSARDDLLRRLFETLSHFLQYNAANKNISSDEQIISLENAMKDNPYGFQPKQEQMANFHAIVQQQLGLAASSYYQQTQDYLFAINSSEKGHSEQRKQWEQLGIQGFADIAARLDEKYQGKNNQTLLIESIKQLPIPVFRALGLCLENHRVSKQMTQMILELVTKEINGNNDNTSLASICSTSIRATAQSSDKKLQAQLLTQILSSSIKTDIEVLASISGRCWQQLSQSKILSLYIEALAITDMEQYPGAFNAIISDLMFIPGVRDNILQAFRSTERSAVLVQAIANFFMKHR